MKGNEEGTEGRERENVGNRSEEGAGWSKEGTSEELKELGRGGQEEQIRHGRVWKRKRGKK